MFLLADCAKIVICMVNSVIIIKGLTLTRLATKWRQLDFYSVSLPEQMQRAVLLDTARVCRQFLNLNFKPPPTVPLAVVLPVPFQNSVSTP